MAAPTGDPERPQTDDHGAALFGIVIAAHNAEPWIADTLRSVLAQTRRDYR